MDSLNFPLIVKLHWSKIILEIKKEFNYLLILFLRGDFNDFN